MYYVIVNPASKSGKGHAIWTGLEPIFQEQNVPYRVLYSKGVGHVTKAVAKLTAPDKNGKAKPLVKLIILGGDGTVNEALQGIQDFERIWLGYIPTGSSNDLARDLQLPKDPSVILRRILDGRYSRTMDLGLLTYTDTSGERSRIRTNGKLTYLIIALRQLIAAKSTSCDIYLDDGQTPIHFDRFLFTAFMIHKYEGGGFKFCPMADESDGKLDLCVVGKLPKPVIIAALPTAFWGKHYIFSAIRHYSASKVTFRSSIPLWVHTDGEVYRKADSITVSCLPQKLKLMM